MAHKITKQLLRNFETYLKNAEKAESTLIQYIRDVKVFFEWLGGRTVDKHRVMEYKHKLIDEYAPRSVNAKLASLNSFFNFCKWFGCKVKSLKIQKQIFARTERELTKKEYEALLNAAKRQNKQRLYRIIQTICATGIRVSELRFITAEAVKNGRATINCKGKMRDVFLPNELCKILTAYMKKYNIVANKKLGQNFLIDDEAIDKIVDSANLTKEDLVIEIGPGLGTLTSMLLEKAGKVIAIELDDRMVKILQDRFLVYNNFELINEDVLKVNLPEIIEANNQFKSVKVVANLPYYITTPIIMKLLENRLNIESITIMIQKEVAERIVATPGSKLSGAITYSVHYYAEPEEVTIVPNTSFIPSPEVDSEVIKLVIRKEPPVELKDEKLFFNIIKASFMQRRKTLANGLVNGGILQNKTEAVKLLKNIGLEENVRGEELSLEQFAKLSNEIYLRK